MGFLTRFFQARDAPTNSTSGAAYSFFMGISAAGKSVNERSAMQMTAVYACVRILSEAIAGLPLHMYRYETDGTKKKAIDHPLYHKHWGLTPPYKTFQNQLLRDEIIPPRTSDPNV